MINSRRYSKIALLIFTIFYFISEFKFDVELITILTIITTSIIIYNGVLFRIKEKECIELGEKEDFRNSPKFVIILLIAMFLFLYYGVPKINELDLFPDVNRKSKIWWIPLLMLLPQIVESLLGVVFLEMKTKYYATEIGLLKSLEAKEVFFWEDFYKFKILESQSIIRFQKKNLKYFFIKYDEEYFNEYREEITSFLNKKLIKE